MTKNLRWKMLAILLAIILMGYADRANLSIAMAPIMAEYGYTDKEKGQIFASFYVGYAVAQMISGYFAQRFGPKWIIFIACFSWSCFEILTIYAAGNFYLFILIRVLLGIGEGLAFPALHTFVSVWMLKKEASNAIGLITGFTSLGTIMALLISPLMISISWQFLFVCFGVVGLLCCVPWAIVGSSSPRSSKWITEEEKELILKAKITEEELVSQEGVEIELLHGEPLKISELQSNVSIPWGRIFHCKAVWAIIIAQYTNSYGFYLFLNYLPSYMMEVHNFDLQGSGVVSMIPTLLQLLLLPVVAHLNQLNYSTKIKRITFQLIGTLCAAFCLLISRLAPKALAISSLFVGLSIYSFTVYGGTYSHFDISPKYAGVVFSIGNTAGNLPGFTASLITGFVLEYSKSWDIVFAICGLHYVFGAVVWVLWFSDRVCIE